MSYIDITKLRGLSQEEAAERLATDGPNELPSSKRRSIFVIIFEVIKEPMFLLLVSCGTIYLLLGDRQEAFMLLFFVFVVMGITIFQEKKTERALEALRDLSSPRALVIRNGAQQRIAGRDVVRGDFLILQEGDRVPADCILISCINLTVDESLLTGESVPVRKTNCDNEDELMGKPGGDDQPYIFSGTLVVSGQGVAITKSTGSNTEIGKIGKALQKLDKNDDTRLQHEISRLVRNVAFFGLALCIVVFAMYGFTKTDWLGGLLAGLTLAMAMLPEEFPVVLTIFMALGAWRMSKKDVLTRKMPAIETLGSATVLCVDKTGTLTQNKMTVVELMTGGEIIGLKGNEKELPEDFHSLVEFAVLASEKNPYEPMDRAIRELGAKHLGGTEHLHDDWEFIQEYPLSKELFAISQVWKSTKGGGYVIAAKGAPEAIADLCHLDKQAVEDINSQVFKMASEGLRVLGVARAYFMEPGGLPKAQHGFDFEFLGLVGFFDPVRESVPQSIKECYEAGIRVVMITGDYPVTACKIARSIGLENSGEYITGHELDEMSDEALNERIGKVNVFARVVPEQKLKLVQALKAKGEIVAMTGDGVNDAPALKAADIGVAMGGRGTDVAREASSLVLLKDDFSSIVDSVRMGRRIYENIQKALAYIVAIHVPIAGISLLPVLLKWPTLFTPMHIVFMELVIDPACSIVFEAEQGEKNSMKRPPRNPNAPLFGAGVFMLSALQGVGVLLVILLVNFVALRMGRGEFEARTLTFTTLVVSNLALILVNRSWNKAAFEIVKTKNQAFWWVFFGAIVFLGLVLYVQFLQNLFKFTTLHASDILICLCAGLLSVVWFEVFKKLRTRKRRLDARDSKTGTDQ